MSGNHRAPNDGFAFGGAKSKALQEPGDPRESGRHDAVHMTPEDCDQLQDRQQFIEAVQEGLNDVAAGRVVYDRYVVRKFKLDDGSAR